MSREDLVQRMAEDMGVPVEELRSWTLEAWQRRIALVEAEAALADGLVAVVEDAAGTARRRGLTS